MANHWLMTLASLACVIFGLGLSLVPFLIMWYAVYRFVYKSWPNRKTKTVLLLIALLVTTPCFVGYDLYKNNIDWYTLYLWLPYAAVTVISIWYYKLNPLHNVVEVSH
jgi:membrane-associated HD superfamily phosphohydrolase